MTRYTMYAHPPTDFRVIHAPTAVTKKSDAEEVDGGGNGSGDGRKSPQEVDDKRRARKNWLSAPSSIKRSFKKIRKNNNSFFLFPQVPRASNDGVLARPTAAPPRAMGRGRGLRRPLPPPGPGLQISHASPLGRCRCRPLRAGRRARDANHLTRIVVNGGRCCRFRPPTSRGKSQG